MDSSGEVRINTGDGDECILCRVLGSWVRLKCSVAVGGEILLNIIQKLFQLFYSTACLIRQPTGYYLFRTSW